MYERCFSFQRAEILLPFLCKLRSRPSRVNCVVSSCTRAASACDVLALPEIWDKMAEIRQISIQYGDQIRL